VSSYSVAAKPTLTDMGRKGKVQLVGCKRELGKKERYLLRTGKLNKAERRIVLLREERKAAGGDAAAEAVLLRAETSSRTYFPPPAEPSPTPALPEAAAPAPSDPEAWLAEAAARNLGGVDSTQQLRRLARVRDAEEEARQRKVAATLTPAAASLLADLRAGSL